MSGPFVVSPTRKIVADTGTRSVVKGGVDWISTVQGGPTLCEHPTDTVETRNQTTYHHLYLNPQRRGTDPTLVYHTPVQTHEVEKLNGVSGFATGSAELTPQMRGELALELPALIEQLQRNPNHVIHISGHTDTTGTSAINKELSEKRADAVVAALKEMLPEPYRNRAIIATQGKADSELKVAQTGACAANRRVELSVAEVSTTRSRSYVHATNSMQAYTSVLPMTLDLGLGSETQRVYGSLSQIEARTDLILERRTTSEGTDLKPAQFNIICQNPKNLSILLDGPTQNCSLLGDARNPNELQVRRDGVLVAVITLTCPDGTLPNLSDVNFGTISQEGVVLSKPTIVMGKAIGSAAQTPQNSTPTSPPMTPPAHRFVATKHTGPAL